MKNPFLDALDSRAALLGLALTASLGALPPAQASFLPTGAGPYDYDDLANWNGGIIDNNFSANPTADQVVTFDGNLTLSSSWSIANTTLFSRSFIGSGADRTVTLGGTISLGSSPTNANKVTIGSTTAGQRVHLDLGGSSRTLSVGTNRTLEIVNDLSGTGSVTKQGLGTLTLTGTANTYTGATSIGTSGQGSGVLEVTKLANGGQASSIGTSSNGTSSLVFGGTSTGTLRYIGTGDSTDRRFLVGGVGAIFDASGSGAINFTNTAGPAYASTGLARTITFTGSNTGDNTMSASFSDSGAGAISFAKTGSGRWILAGTNTNTGSTTVTAGTLVLGATGSIANSVGVSIAAGAVFDTTAQSFTMLGGQEFTFTLDPASGGAAGLLAAGALDITAGVVDFTVLGPLDDDVYVIASYTSLTGANFASVSSLPSGYTIDYAYNGGTQIALVVPEPGTIGLLTGGLCAVLIFGRNRRKAS